MTIIVLNYINDNMFVIFSKSRQKRFQTLPSCGRLSLAVLVLSINKNIPLYPVFIGYSFGCPVVHSPEICQNRFIILISDYMHDITYLSIKLPKNVIQI